MSDRYSLKPTGAANRGICQTLTFPLSLIQANGIDDLDLIYPGQYLVIPGYSTSASADATWTPAGDPRIDVDLSEQWLTAYEGETPVFGTAVSTGADYYAIHGAYWHTAFGYPVSHGCVNLPVSAAGWLYNWASTGTPVVIHY